MAEIRSGVLMWKGKPKPYGGGRWDGRLLVVVEGDKHHPIAKPERVLATDLRRLSADELDELKVEFDWDGTQVRAVRRPGTAVAVEPVVADGLARLLQFGKQTPPVETGTRPVDEFHNPYTFVPMLDRREAVFPDDNRGLADGLPAGHDAYLDGLWSGHIGVTMTTATPLLLLDTADPTTLASEHKIYGPMLRDGNVHLPSIAVKGMLRAAYEAVTNSRLGVFTRHDKPLGFRPNAKANLVPARIGSSGTTVDLMLGTSDLRLPGGGTGVLHAAWLPAYTGRPMQYPDGTPPKHGDDVRVRLQKVQHHRWKNGRHEPDFRYWQVVSIAKNGQKLPPKRSIKPADFNDGKTVHEPLEGDFHEAVGSVFVTNQNFSRKHDERVFFGRTIEKNILPEILSKYSDLIENYRAAHRDADIVARPHNGGIATPDRWIGRDPGETAWSPHLYQKGTETLHPGDLCYAEVAEHSGEVVGLYPVLISRRLYETSPLCLVPRELQPATRMEELSPADRVFGWVNAAGHGAYRGQLRIGSVDATGAQIDKFDGQGVPLAILGQPKPQQGRFYAEAGPTTNRNDRDAGAPVNDPVPKEGWYTERGSLRGRKVYPHHAGLPEGYWKDPTKDRTQIEVDGRYQEYRRPRKELGKGRILEDRKRFATLPESHPNAEQRDNQNRSVTAWVTPGSTFKFSIEVINLSSVELGALLWLLDLPDKHYHRFGLGKPLGFGSVRLELDDSGTVLRSGEDWRAYYSSFATEPPGTGPDMGELVSQFKNASEVWEGQPHLKAFEAAARGDDKVPVHYPRIRPIGEDPVAMDRTVPVPPDPRGQAYAWFVANEKVEREKLVNGSSLPAAGGDPLTVYEVEVKT